MEVRRTVPVKLDVAESDADLLHETIHQFQWAANYIVQYARNDDGYVETSKGKLNSRTYDDVRRETDLHANLVQAARSRAAEALKSIVAKWKRGKNASLPHFTSPFLEYDKRSATFHDDHGSLSTVGGRITAEYVLLDEDRDTPHSLYLFSDDYETTGATLHYRETTDEFYLHVRIKADVDAPEPRENGTVLGVDLGVENIAVTSTGVFWSASELDHWHREYEKRRASLQQCGSRYAHENVQVVGRKETGRFEQLLHRVANEPHPDSNSSTRSETMRTPSTPTPTSRRRTSCLGMSRRRFARVSRSSSSGIARTRTGTTRWSETRRLYWTPPHLNHGSRIGRASD